MSLRGFAMAIAIGSRSNLVIYMATRLLRCLIRPTIRNDKVQIIILQIPQIR